MASSSNCGKIQQHDKKVNCGAMTEARPQVAGHLKSSVSYSSQDLLALLQDAAAFDAGVIIALITPIVFRAKPWITRRAAAGLTAKRARRATSNIATIVA
jgi:hypothetical protein